MNLLFITWDFNPSVIPSLNIPRWYGIMWALGYLIGLKILERMFKHEKIDKDWADKTFLYVLLGGILGARFGHCIFYDWEYYSSNPLDMLKIWEGGLASHGGVAGIAIAAYLLSRNVTKKPILWIIDRIVVPTGFAGGLIRLGNLFNHEILGKETTSSIGFKFLRDDSVQLEALQITGTKDLDSAYSMLESTPENFSAYFDLIPIRYPAQLIEAICYFVIFAIMFYFYWRTNAKKLQGFLTGAFFAMVFGARFVIEYIKESQGGTDTNLDLFNMGQRLSIPLVLFGLFLVFRRIKQLKFSKEKE